MIFFKKFYWIFVNGYIYVIDDLIIKYIFKFGY